VDRAPRVTLFKPLAGRDDDLDANLESFARIDYPSFEILFGVASPETRRFSWRGASWRGTRSWRRASSSPIPTPR
jgi:hypothetical protein